MLLSIVAAETWSPLLSVAIVIGPCRVSTVTASKSVSKSSMSECWIVFLMAMAHPLLVLLFLLLTYVV